MGEEMTAKEYLKQLELLNEMINQKISQVDELREMAMGGGMGIRYDKDPVQTSVSGDAGTNKIIKYIDLENEVNADIDRYVDLKNKIINQIHGIKNVNHMKLLYKRYVEFKRLEVISVEMNFSYDHTRRLHGYALLDFERTYQMKKDPKPEKTES